MINTIQRMGWPVGGDAHEALWSIARVVLVSGMSLSDFVRYEANQPSF